MSKRKINELEGHSTVGNPKETELEEEEGQGDGLESTEIVDLMCRAMEKLSRILQEDNCTEQLTGDFHEWIELNTRVSEMSKLWLPHIFSPVLYHGFNQSLHKYITSTFLQILKEREKYKHADELLYLTAVAKQWQISKRMLKQLCKLLDPMLKQLCKLLDPTDSSFYFHYNHPSPLYELGIMRLHELAYPEIQNTATDAAIAFIHKQREGHRLEGVLLKNVVDILLEVGIDCYMKNFESALLQDTAAYYSRKGGSWIEEHKNHFPDFLVKAEASLEFEREKVAHYFHFTSENKLLEIVSKEVLTHGESYLFESRHSGWHAMLRDHRVEDLSRVYRLFSYIPNGLEPLAHSFRQHVVGEGTSLLGHADGVSAQVYMVGKLLELHEKHLQYIQDYFMNDGLFQRALKGAFEVVCRNRVAGISCAQLLATFCDNILKTSGMKEEEFENMLDKTRRLFAHISEKDIFAEYHREYLAQRLLNHETADGNRERNILRKLKQHCGEQFTYNMEKMLSDSALARDTQNEFKEYLIANPCAHPGIEFTAMVLQAGPWPSDKLFGKLNLPPEMATCVEVFKEFHRTKQTNIKRKLTWIYSMGTCNITGYFDSGMKEIIATPYQAFALLLFNTTEILSYSEIRSHLNLTDEETSLLLDTVACGRYKILNKYPDIKSVTQTDTFEFNARFTHIRERFSILPTLEQAAHKKERVMKDANIYRHEAIDALIVRIMKSKRLLDHKNLVKQCIEQLGHRFQLDNTMITKRIEGLIAREFLERDEDAHNTYRYLQ